MSTTHVVLGNEQTANAQVWKICTNNFCSNTLHVKIDFASNYNFEDVDKLADDIGWVKRTFAKDVRCDFCCHDCAYNSKKAKYLEEVWFGKNIELKNSFFTKSWKIFIKGLDWFVDHVIP